MTTPSSQPDPRYQEIEELSEVCKQGNLNRARELLQKHPDVLDTPDRDERFVYPGSCLWSPLGRAAWHGHEDIVRFLLQAGANPVPFEVAAQYHQHTYGDWMNELRERGYHSVVELIEAAIHPRYGPPLDNGNIRQAIRDGDVDRVRTLLVETPQRVFQVDAVGNTPLHLAVAANQLPLVRLLLEHGSPPDARNGDSRTPAVIALLGLHRWWRNEHKPEILDLLLKSGADYTLLLAATLGDEPRLRWTALRYPKVYQLLQQHGANPDLSLLAVAGDLRRRYTDAAGQLRVIVFLVETCGANLNYRNDEGMTPLAAAAREGHRDIVEYLLAKGASPDPDAPDWAKPLRLAENRGHLDIANLLR